MVPVTSLLTASLVTVGMAASWAGKESAPAGRHPSCAASASGPTAPAGDESRPLASGEVAIPFPAGSEHILVPVSLNGSKPVSMVLDTGMSAPIVLLFDTADPDGPALDGGQEVQVAGAGDGQPAMGRMVPGVTVAVGDLVLAGQTVVVTEKLCGPNPVPVDGVIGKSIFDHHAVDIDFARSRLTIRDSAGLDPAGMVSLPLTLDTGIPVVEAVIEDEAGREVPARLVVDLGARHVLSLDLDPEGDLRPPTKTLEAVVGRGIQGEVAGSVGRLGALRLGSLRLPGVISSFTRPESGVSCAAHGSRADGNLGLEALRRFHVIIDYPGRRLLLAPLPGFDRPFEYNMAGLSLQQHADGSYVVRSVVSESPAQEAGLAAGDRIVAIDDRAPDATSHATDMELFRQPGRSLRLAIARDGRRQERTVVLRRLI